MKFPTLRNTQDRYGAIAQLLHWLVVLGILLQFIWAWRIDETDSIRQQFALVVEHKSIGMTVLGLAIIRLLWRAFNPPPPYPSSMAGWERTAASITHWLLYAMILLMPLSGWAWSTAAGYGAEFYGLLDIPGFVPVNEDLADVLEEVHEALAIAIPVVAGVHIAAALRHHFVLKDNVLRRMLPGGT